MATKYTKRGKNIPNNHKVYQMAIKYANIFHRNTLQNLPYWDFWFENMPSGKPVSKSKSSVAKNGGKKWREKTVRP
jgi:hypothetical protein